MDAAELLDRGIPDVLSTTDLPRVLAAELDYHAGRPAPWTERADADPGVRARAFVQAGKYDAARRVLATSPAGPPTPQGLAARAWAASRVGPPDVVETLERAVGALPRQFLFDDDVPLGPQELFAGLLAGAGGRTDVAVDALTAAVAAGDRRAPFWGALARLELARVLLSSELVSGSSSSTDGARASVLVSAQTFFAAGGYRHLRRVADELGAQREPAAVAAASLGHLVAGDEWIVGFGVQPTVSMRAGKGLLALRYLIEHRGRRVAAVALDGFLSGDWDRMPPAGEGARRSAISLEALRDDRARTRVSKLLRRTIGRLGGVHGLLGEHLAASVHTGYACRYEADSRITWRL